MKRITYILVLAMLWHIPVFGQAFSDVAEIEKLSRGTDLNKGEKIAALILPYFTVNGAIDRKRVDLVLNKELKEFVNKFLDQKAANLTVIKSFATAKPVAAINEQFTVITSTLADINAIINQHKKNVIFGLPDKLDENNVPAKFNIEALENGLKQIDSLEKLTVAYDSTLLKNLKIQFNIKDESPTELITNITDLKAKITAVNSAKTIIFTTLQGRLLEELLIFGTVNNSNNNITRTSLTQAAQNFTIQQTIVQPNVAQATALSNFKLPSQSEMIDAMVIFISKRFSQEVAISFMEVIKKRAKTMKLVSDLFPITVALLGEGNAYEVPKVGSAWHQSIAQDLFDLPINIKKSTYIEEKIKNGNQNNYLKLFEDVITIAQLAREGSSLPEIVTLYKSDFYKLNDPTLSLGFELINLINQELSHSNSDTTKKAYWINWTTLNNLQGPQWQLFLQLVTSKYKTTIFNDRNINLPIDQLSDAQWVAFKNYLSKALMLLNQFQDRKLTVLPNDVNFKNIKTMSFWDCQQQLFNLLLTPPIKLPEGSIKTLKFINKGLQLYKLQEDGNYPAMIRESMQIIEEIIPQPIARLNLLLVKEWKVGRDRFEKTYADLEAKLQPLNTLYTTLIQFKGNQNEKLILKALTDFETNNNFSINGVTVKEKLAALSTNYIESLKSIDNGKAEHLLAIRSSTAINNLLSTAITGSNKKFAVNSDQSKKGLTLVLKTAEFFTDVMSAKDSKQLSQVIEAYAMPPNSYKIKRNSRYSIDIDAHIGLYGGVEYLGSKTPDSIHSFAPVWGLSAPIGISFSWGSRSLTKAEEVTSFINRDGEPRTLRGNSFSFTVSIIDIAAPLAFRLSNDAEEALPKQVTWSQLFSPGLHLRWGIKNTPLNFSTGLQYTPQLRKIDQKQNHQQAYRAYAGLFFDLPLFNIYKR